MILPCLRHAASYHCLDHSIFSMERSICYTRFLLFYRSIYLLHEKIRGNLDESVGPVAFFQGILFVSVDQNQVTVER